MKVYLVGGAVRDKALGLPIHEKDWLVIGGTPEYLLQQGYQQVGREFPVFIHPKTGEEYALARKERKSGHGYVGFICDFGPEVTLEEDLSRRDLTINAMALSEDGHWIDPFHGMSDIRQKLLRHVSPAFVEDPVRVLRVARFAARFSQLGFQVAPETQHLMYTMVRNKEVHHLVSERVWQEWEKALYEANPEIFFEVLRACGALEIILPEIHCLFGVPSKQSMTDTGLRMLNRIQYAAKHFHQKAEIVFAAALMEIGFGVTSPIFWPFHPHAEELGIKILKQLCMRLRVPTQYYELARLTLQMHQKMSAFAQQSAEDILAVLEKTDAFRRPSRFYQVLNAVQCHHQEQSITQQWIQSLAICNQVNASDLTHLYQGKAISDALRLRRIELLVADRN